MRGQFRTAERLAARLATLYDAGEFSLALSVGRRLLHVVSRALPDSAPEVLDAKRNLAEMRRLALGPEHALSDLFPVFRLERRLGRSRSRGFSETCNNIGVCMIDLGRYRDAASFFERSLSALNAFRNADPARVQVIYKNLGDSYARSNQIEEAAAVFAKGLRLAAETNGLDLDLAGDCLENLVYCLIRLGRLPAADRVLQEAQALLNTRGAATLFEGQLLMCRGAVSASRLKHADAARWNTEAFTLFANRAPEISDGRLLARAALNTADNYISLGVFDQAVLMAESGKTVADSIGNLQLRISACTILGKALRQAGHYHLSRSSLNDALTLWRAGRNPSEAAKIAVLNNLALLDFIEGDSIKAVATLREAVQAATDSRVEAEVLTELMHSLAYVVGSTGDPVQSADLLEKALETVRSTKGVAGEEVARCLNTLGWIEAQRGNVGRAEQLYLSAIAAVKEKAGTEFTVEAAAPWNNLGTLAHRMGRHRDAIRYFENALAANRSGHDDSHPDSVSSLFNLAAVHWAMQDWETSLALRERAAAGLLARLPTMLVGGRDTARRHLVTSLRGQLASTISFHLENRADRNRSAWLASELIVQTRGVVLDAAAQDIANIAATGDPASQRILRRLRKIRRCRAEIALRSSTYQSLKLRNQSRRLRQREAELEGRLSAMAATIHRETPLVDLATILSSLPEAAVLIEYLRVRSFHPGRGEWGNEHYVAMVLRRGVAPVVEEVAEAEPVERASFALYRSLGDPKADFSPPARTLYETLLQPLSRFLNRVSDLYIVPDGILNGIPFAALLSGGDEFLGERYAFAYLASSRDLARSVTRAKDPAVFIFDSEDPGIERGMLVETEMARRLFPEAVVCTERGKALDVLGKVRGPRLVHLGMHGAFLTPPRDSTMGAENVSLEEAAQLNAMLALTDRSRLKLFLTALEAASLDLQGTQLVVLAACESGLGAFMYGDGAYGFRRAFTLAGAAAQIVTLWQVADVPTAELLVKFYESAGTSRPIDAFAAAQRAMAAVPSHRHPYFWASAILCCGPRELKLWEDV